MMDHARFHRFLVNAITFSRIPLIAAYAIVAVLAQVHHLPCLVPVALFLMFLAAISDLFDGMLARKWHVVSTFGKMADPLMDKVFFIVAFPTVLWLAGTTPGGAVQSRVLLLFTILYIVRDQWVTFLRSVAGAYGADVGAMWLGKIRTALSFPAAGIIYAYLAYDACLTPALRLPLACGVYAMEGALILLNIWSCWFYTLHYAPYLRRAIFDKKEK